MSIDFSLSLTSTEPYLNWTTDSISRYPPDKYWKTWFASIQRRSLLLNPFALYVFLQLCHKKQLSELIFWISETVVANSVSKSSFGSAGIINCQNSCHHGSQNLFSLFEAKIDPPKSIKRSVSSLNDHPTILKIL